MMIGGDEELQRRIRENARRPLHEKRCLDCWEQYDTPHKNNCARSRATPTPSGARRVLVKYEDV